jgi:alpha-2-macroglobulin
VDSMYAERWSSLVFASTASTIASLGRILSPSGWVRDLGLYGSMASNSAVAIAATGARSTTVESIPRTDFRTTAFYLASLETDTNGVVTAATKLPDNLTTYRVVAVAVDRGDRFGSAEAGLIITKPLIARAALPRFMRTGDEFVAGAIITNQTGADVSSTVTASARAAAVRGRERVERRLPNGSSAEVRFAWRATAAPGDTAAFRFAVVGGTNADALETPLVVRAPYSPRFHNVAGLTNGNETVRMMLPRGIDPERSRLTLRVGTTPVTPIRAAYDFFRFYPYLCSEQLASRGRTIIAMLRLERAGLLDSSTAPSHSVLQDDLQWIVDEMARRQMPNGGVGYWSGTSWTSGPLSAYAGMVLLDARDVGATVRPSMLERTVAYMKESLEETTALPDSSPFGTAAMRRLRNASYLGARLAALQFLRRAGSPDVVREDELRSNSQFMVWEDRVWLVDLLSRREDRTAARQMLAEVWRDVEITGRRVDVPDSLVETFGFRSHVRPIARLLEATLAVDPDHPQLGRLVERVVQQGSATRDRWWNTQDYAFRADALTQVAVWQRTSAPDAVVVVQSAVRRAEGRELLRSVPGRNAGISVSLDGLVERDGEWTVLPLRISAANSRAFYALTVEEVPLKPPTTPDAQGMVVERWYERFDDGRPVSEVKEGDLVRARIRVTVPADREFVAIADPLPAGLQVVDLSLRTSRSIGPFESEASEAAERAGDQANRGAGRYYGTWYGGWWSPWEHRDVRDDRVVYFARVLWKGTYTATYVARATTAGTFIRPPAHAEEMYNPSLGGRSEGGTFKVIPK